MARDPRLVAEGQPERFGRQLQRQALTGRQRVAGQCLPVRQGNRQRGKLQRKARRLWAAVHGHHGGLGAGIAGIHQRIVSGVQQLEGTASPFLALLPPADQAYCQSVGGDPNIFYYHSHWELREDQALVIHIDKVPECSFWNLQINNYWLESLDYRYHQICINKHQAQYDENGGVTLVLSEKDPGIANWLQTAGVRQGTMCLRWVGAKEQCHPTTKVISRDQLLETV